MSLELHAEKDKHKVTQGKYSGPGVSFREVFLMKRHGWERRTARTFQAVNVSSSKGLKEST